MKNFKYIIILLTLTCAAYGIYRFESARNFIHDISTKTKELFVDTQTTVVEEPLFERIDILNNLVCMTYYDEYAHVAEKKNMILADDRIVIIYKVTLKFGFDLSSLTKEDITTNGDSIIINLPQPIPLIKVCNPSDMLIFRDSDAWTREEIAEFRNVAINKVVDNAINANAYEVCKRKAEEYFLSLFNALGYKHCIINIEDVDCFF